MKSSQLMIITAAIVLVAAFAGIALVDDSDAAEVGEVDTISYKIGDASYEVDLNGETFTVGYDKSDADVLYWTGADGVVYYIGQTVDIGDIDSRYLNGTMFRLTATLAEAGKEYATVVIDDVSYIIPVADGKLDASDTAYVAAKAIYDDLTGAGYSLTWGTNDDPFDEDTTVEAGTEYELETGIGTVIWVVDGIVIKTLDVGEDGTVAIPEAPLKEYYTFAGWSLSSGGAVAIEYVASTEEYVGAAVDGDKESGYTVSVSDTDSDTGAVTFYAVFNANIYTVTFTVGGETVETMLVAHGATIAAVPALPEGYASWDFDFSTVITGDMTIEAVEAVDAGVYIVTFVVDGVTVATYTSAAVTLPDTPVKEGYEFVGWYIGSELIADPVAYEFTQDTVFTAGFRAVSVVEYDVTFAYADGTTETVQVAEGAEVELPELDEGMVWAYDGKVYTAGAVTQDMTLTEVREYYTVTFTINGLTYQTVEVRYGETVAEPEYEYDGYEGWDFDFSQAIYADVTIEASPEVVEEAPAFYETTIGQVAIVIAVFVILALIYAVYSNMFGLRDKLSKGKSETETKEEE